MDTPSARSNHKAPVPRGGGVVMIGAALVFLWLEGMDTTVLLSALGLCAVSFIDDWRGGLSPLIRLLVQCIAVAVCITALPGRIFPDYVPVAVEWAFVALAWLWFINLTNFMDGIDGISAMQAILMLAGICMVRLVDPVVPHDLAAQACVVAASAYGFYRLNRSPAKLFMGDSGSVPLGFLNGYLLLSVAAWGQPLPALILPAYYLFDATFTLLKRLLRKEKIWLPHSQHAYQQAVRSGRSHAAVVAEISWLNAIVVVLAMLATISMMAGIAAVIAAYALSASLFYRFTHAHSVR
jgi:UDP-N-acetylmuramyl pentapeptide phosphotransferase/UDP-N-acetylglucosamine-1-phosphate transferase